MFLNKGYFESGMVDVRLEAGSAQNALKKAVSSDSFPDDVIGVRIVNTQIRENMRGSEYEDVTVYHIEYIKE